MHAKTIFLIGLFLLAQPAFADTIGYECTPELGTGEEVLSLSLNLKNNKASLLVDKKPVANCQKAPFQGELVEYGESELSIRCQGGEITLRQDFDETLLDIESLGLGLSDTTYMCN